MCSVQQNCQVFPWQVGSYHEKICAPFTLEHQPASLVLIPFSAFKMAAALKRDFMFFTTKHVSRNARYSLLGRCNWYGSQTAGENWRFPGLQGLLQEIKIHHCSHRTERNKVIYSWDWIPWHGYWKRFCGQILCSSYSDNLFVFSL